MSTTTRRRLRTYGRRMGYMFLGGLKHKCFFMHIPKCGGTSISEAIASTVPMSDRVGPIDANATRRTASLIHADKNELLLYHDDLPNCETVYEIREQLLLMHMAWETELIYGHIPFSIRADRHFGENYKYITILREPYARLVSNFNGSKRHGLIDMEFSAYLESDIGRRHAFTTLRYFTNRHELDAGTAASAIDEALETAQLFSVIGHLEDLDAFSSDFNDVFGRRPRVFEYNKATTNSYKPNESERKIALKLLEPELEFRNEVLKMQQSGKWHNI